MVKMRWLLTCACGIPLSLAGTQCMYAQSSNDADKHFVSDAIEGGNDEVALGRLAQKKGNSDEVKQFAQKMVDDHTRMGDKMRAVAQQVGVTSPTGTSMSEKATETKLSMLSGNSFDKAYMEAMVKDHRDDLAAFNKEISSGSDPAVKSAARSGARTITSHLKMAEQVAANRGVDVQKASR